VTRRPGSNRNLPTPSPVPLNVWVVRRRRRPYEGVILLAILAAAGVFYYKGTHPAGMGDAAPRFGSTPALSTAAGFLKGTWVCSHDVHGTLPSDKAFKFMENASPNRLKFEADGRYVLNLLGHDVHGTWVYDGKTVTMQALDVDGEAPAEVQRDYDAFLAQPSDPERRPPHRDWYTRGTCLQAGEALKEITLDGDQRRLVTVTLRQGMFGKEYWIRES